MSTKYAEVIKKILMSFQILSISLNLISTSIHGTRKKDLPGTRDKSISNQRTGDKEQIIGQNERKGQPRPTP